jgi:hypothetical protein
VPFSCDLGTLTSWNPLGHSRPVTGLLYLYLPSNMKHAASSFVLPFPLLTCYAVFFHLSPTVKVGTTVTEFNFIIYIYIYIYPLQSGPGSVGKLLATSWKVRDSNPGGGEILRTGPGAHPASFILDTGSLPGVKRPGRYVIPPSSIYPVSTSTDPACWSVDCS